MGGEEFMIVLPNTNKEQAQVIAEQIRFNIDQDSWEHTRITVSIGVTTYEPADNLSKLFSKADEALYRSKKAGTLVKQNLYKKPLDVGKMYPIE